MITRSLPLTAERRALLDAIKATNGQWSLASLSRALGRNAAYLHQYVHRHSPRRLPESDRHYVAQWLNVPDQQLRAPADILNDPAAQHILTIPFLDIESAAGHASIIDDFAETNQQDWQFTSAIMNQLTHSGVEHLRLISVRGDSMSPQLEDGDIIMIDLANNDASQAGIFVLDDGQGLVVKQLTLLPPQKDSISAVQKVRIVSMNNAYAPYRRAYHEIRIIGRVIWMARTLSAD